MCWRKQITYAACRHVDYRNVDCTEQKQQHKSSWLILVCPCFSPLLPSTPATPPPQNRACIRKPVQFRVKGKCPRCLQEDADAEPDRFGPDTVAPERPKNALTASRRKGFIGDRNLHAEGRLGCVNAYGVAGHQRHPGPPTSHSTGMDPRRADGDGRGIAAAGASLSWEPPQPHAYHEETLDPEPARRQQRRLPQVQRTVHDTDYSPPQAQRVPVYRDGGQGSSVPTAGPGKTTQEQHGWSRDSTSHLIPPPLQTSGSKTNGDVSRTARANNAGKPGGSAARARQNPPLSVIVENLEGEEGHQSHIVGSPQPGSAHSNYTPDMSLDELIDEVEVLWQMAPKRGR